ncbi:MAG: ImmA/IrrE family metallo-endopeptidase [Aristaeellaceae bacterium]
MIRRPDYDRAATAACRVLVRLQVNTLPVRPMEILRRCRDTYLCTFDQAAEVMNLPEDALDRLCAGADAFTVRAEEGGRQGYVVCYRAGGNPARLNFTLAHELGHIVLHHQETGPAEEAEADCFASHLLCPEVVVQCAACRSAEMLAHLCYISRPAAERAMARAQCHVEEELRRQVTELLLPAVLADTGRMSRMANEKQCRQANKAFYAE